MAIEIKGNPLAQVLSQGMQSLPAARARGYERNLQERQHQLQVDQFEQQKNMNQLQMAQQLLQLRTFQDENLMDAAGYRNPLVSKYFSNLKYQGGELKSNPNIPGGWEWSGQQALPSREEALLDYERFATAGGKSWTTNDATLFNKNYDEAMMARGTRVAKEIQKLRHMNLTPDDINDILSQPENQHLANAISTVYSDSKTAPEVQDILREYLPKKQFTTSQIMANLGSAAGTYGMGGIGAYQGLNWLQDYRGTLADKAEAKFGPKRDLYKSQMDTAKEDLKKAKKSKAKTAKSKVKTLTKKVDKLTDKYNKQKVRTESNKRKFVKKNRLTTKFFKGLKKPFPAAFAASMATPALASLGESVAGTKGKAWGQMGGAGLKGALGTRSLWRLGKGALNVGKGLLWRTPVAAAGAASDFVSPAMDAAMAAWLISSAKSDWDASMKSFDRAKAGR